MQIGVIDHAAGRGELARVGSENTLRWVARLHRAFYGEGTDVTDPAVFPELLDGFPTLLSRYGDDLGIVIRGFAPRDELEPALTDWLEDRYGDLVAGLACDPETGSC